MFYHISYSQKLSFPNLQGTARPQLLSNDQVWLCLASGDWKVWIYDSCIFDQKTKLGWPLIKQENSLQPTPSQWRNHIWLSKWKLRWPKTHNNSPHQLELFHPSATEMKSGITPGNFFTSGESYMTHIFSTYSWHNRLLGGSEGSKQASTCNQRIKCQSFPRFWSFKLSIFNCQMLSSFFKPSISWFCGAKKDEERTICERFPWPVLIQGRGETAAMAQSLKLLNGDFWSFWDLKLPFLDLKLPYLKLELQLLSQFWPQKLSELRWVARWSDRNLSFFVQPFKLLPTVDLAQSPTAISQENITRIHRFIPYFVALLQ